MNMRLQHVGDGHSLRACELHVYGRVPLWIDDHGLTLGGNQVGVVGQPGNLKALQNHGVLPLRSLLLLQCCSR